MTTIFHLIYSLTQRAQEHDLDQAADMERGRGGIKADIARHHVASGESIKALRVGQLVDIAPLVEQAQQIACDVSDHC